MSTQDFVQVCSAWKHTLCRKSWRSLTLAPHELRAGPCGLLFRLKRIGRFLASLVSGCAFSFCLRIFPVDSTHRLTGLQGLKRLKALGDEPILLQDILQLLHILKWPMPLQEQSEKSCGRGDL